MTGLDTTLIVLLVIASVAGGWSVWSVRTDQHPDRTRWGRRLFVGCLVTLGVGNVVALVWAARCLMPFGLSAGWLVIAMLWENPFQTGMRP